ncbi:MAG: alpha/beta fold hydrolase [Halodesulfurarchaeum sp.]
MRLRKLLAWAAGGTVATAAVNRALRYTAGDLPPPLSGSRERTHIRGFEVSYTEAGDPSDETLVLLHGIHAAGTSHEFEAVFEPLSSTYHVVAPDLPGFGLSDRPPISYEASLYVDVVREFLSAWERPIVVASSLAGAYATAAADSMDLGHLVLVCPTAETVGRSGPRRQLFRLPIVGTGLFNLLVSKPSIRYYLQREGYSDPAAVDESTVSYFWTTAHQAGARFAPASFVAGFLDPDLDLGSALSDLDMEVTVVWGRQASRPSLSVGRRLADRADAPLVVIDPAKLLPHVEQPDAFLDGLGQVLHGLEDE